MPTPPAEELALLRSSGYSTLFTLLSGSFSDFAVGSRFQLPSVTNCGEVSASVLLLSNHASTPCAPTYLVVDLVVGRQVHRLLKHAVCFLELDRLAPIVEGSGHVDFFGGVVPREQESVSAYSSGGAPRLLPPSVSIATLTT